MTPLFLRPTPSLHVFMQMLSKPNSSSTLARIPASSPVQPLSVEWPLAISFIHTSLPMVFSTLRVPDTLAVQLEAPFNNCTGMYFFFFFWLSDLTLSHCLLLFSVTSTGSNQWEINYSRWSGGLTAILRKNTLPKWLPPTWPEAQDAVTDANNYYWKSTGKHWSNLMQWKSCIPTRPFGNGPPPTIHPLPPLTEWGNLHKPSSIKRCNFSKALMLLFFQRTWITLWMHKVPTLLQGTVSRHHFSQ